MMAGSPSKRDCQSLWLMMATFCGLGRFFGEEVAAENGLDAEDAEQVWQSDDFADEARMVGAAEADAG